MKYIKSLALLILGIIASACTTITDEPGGNGTIFIPYDVVDCTITGTVINHTTFGKVWNVREMTVYRDWKVDSDTGNLTFVKEEERKETFNDKNPCYVALPKDFQYSQLGETVENLPLQMIVETGTIGESKNIITLGSVIKMLPSDEFNKPAEVL